MNEQRKHALLLAATILAARKLAALDSDRPSPAKLAGVTPDPWKGQLWEARAEWRRRHPKE